MFGEQNPFVAGALMLSPSRVRTQILFGCTLVFVNACAHALSTNNGLRAVDGPGVMDKCLSGEALVVENKTPYPARVTATDGTPNAFATSSELLVVVPSGGVDTIPRMGSHPKIQFDLEQPAMASGSRAPVAGFKARCVPGA
jgi:hypothetical protein